MGYYLPQKSYLKPRLSTRLSNTILAVTATGITLMAAIFIYTSLQFGDNENAFANVNSKKPVNFELKDTEKNIPYIENTGKIDFPASLAFFIVSPYENSVDIKWASVSEYKNEYFCIEKSFNGSDFKEIGRVNGNGTTKLSNDYLFTDDEPPKGVVFYRLKQVSFNGESSFIALEKAESVLPKKEDDLYIENIGPEPFEKNFKIDYYSEIEGSVAVELLDKNGKMVYKSYTTAKRGYNTCCFTNGDNLKEDEYMLRISNSTAVYSKKIKKRA